MDFTESHRIFPRISTGSLFRSNSTWLLEYPPQADGLADSNHPVATTDPRFGPASPACEADSQQSSLADTPALEYVPAVLPGNTTVTQPRGYQILCGNNTRIPPNILSKDPVESSSRGDICSTPKLEKDEHAKNPSLRLELSPAASRTADTSFATTVQFYGVQPLNGLQGMFTPSEVRFTRRRKEVTRFTRKAKLRGLAVHYNYPAIFQDFIEDSEWQQMQEDIVAFVSCCNYQYYWLVVMDKQEALWEWGYEGQWRELGSDAETAGDKVGAEDGPGSWPEHVICRDHITQDGSIVCLWPEAVHWI